jgi:ABC-type phosphate/phosphonate transport system substrate-binding protein
MKIDSIIFILLISLSANTCIASRNDTDQAYEFGVLPYLAPVRLESMYGPAVSEISRLLNRKVYLRTSTSSEKYFANLQQSAFDLAVVNPFDSVPAQEQFGYIAIAARSQHHCSIYTLPQSPIQQFDNLRRKVIGVASPRSPITFYTTRLLNQQDLRAGIDVELKPYPTTHACLHALIVGDISACGASTITADIFRHQRGIELRELAQCEEFPGMVFLVHSRLPVTERKLLRQTILNWSRTENGITLLNTIGPHTRFVSYSPENFKNIRIHYEEWKAIDSATP